MVRSVTAPPNLSHRNHRRGGGHAESPRHMPKVLDTPGAALPKADLLADCEATGVRGLLTVLLGMFDTSGSAKLSREEFATSAAALGFEASDGAWSSLCSRFGTVGESKGKCIDLAIVGDFFSSRYDTMLEAVLRKCFAGLAQLSKRLESLEGGARAERERRMRAVVRSMRHGAMAVAFDGWSRLHKGQQELRQRAVRQWRAGY